MGAASMPIVSERERGANRSTGEMQRNMGGGGGGGVEDGWSPWRQGCNGNIGGIETPRIYATVKRCQNSFKNHPRERERGRERKREREGVTKL